MSVVCSATYTLISWAGCSIDWINWNPCQFFLVVFSFIFNTLKISEQKKFEIELKVKNAIIFSLNLQLQFECDKVSYKSFGMVFYKLNLSMIASRIQ